MNPPQYHLWTVKRNPTLVFICSKCGLRIDGNKKGYIVPKYGCFGQSSIHPKMLKRTSVLTPLQQKDALIRENSCKHIYLSAERINPFSICCIKCGRTIVKEANSDIVQVFYSQVRYPE